MEKDKVPPNLNNLLEQLKALEDSTWEPSGPRAPYQHPELSPLHGGVSGAELEVGLFALSDGFTIRQTFAHLMAPFLMAFAKPRRPRAHHPGPWKAASGGMGYDVTIEIQLEEGVRPTNFDRVNTLWWTLALLRLRSEAIIRMPVISNIAYDKIVESQQEPNFWTIEISTTQLMTRRNPPNRIVEEDLVWVRDHLVSGARLMDDPHFNRAFTTFDSAIWAHSLGAAIVMLWAALETLFRPGRQDIAKKLAASIAALLTSRGPDRDRLFQKTRKLYKARGGTAHASEEPEIEELLATFEIARKVFIFALEQGSRPNSDRLLEEWRSGQNGL